MVRIMHKFKITEISACDRPAQEGARAVIMKRADDDEDHVDVVAIAKALVVDGIKCGATADDFESAIVKRAAAAYPGLSSQQQYSRFIETDPGKTLFKAATMAARSVAQAAQDWAPPQKSFGPAGEELNRLAASMARSKNLSLGESYSRLISDPTRADLVRRVKEEERKATQAVTNQRWSMWPGEKADESRQWLNGKPRKVKGYA
jgi:hypothetical protein